MKHNLVVIPTQIDTVERFKKTLADCMAKKEPLQITIKGLSERSLSQNALLHAWFREYAGYLLSKEVKFVEAKEINYMKITAKRTCYAETHWDWLIEERRDLFTKERSSGLTSTKSWSKGQMYRFMEWLQAFASVRDGLILEAKGEFEKLKQESQGID